MPVIEKLPRLVGGDTGGYVPRATRVDGGAANKQGHGRRRPAVVRQSAEFGDDGGGCGADQVAVDAVAQRARRTDADQVESSRERAAAFHEVATGVGREDGIIHRYCPAGDENTAGLRGCVVGEGTVADGDYAANDCQPAPLSSSRVAVDIAVGGAVGGAVEAGDAADARNGSGGGYGAVDEEWRLRAIGCSPISRFPGPCRRRRPGHRWQEGH